MSKPRIIILGSLSNVDYGKETLTEKIHKILDERGISIDKSPDIVFYNPSSETDRLAVAEILKSTGPETILIGEPTPLSKMEMLDRLFPQEDVLKPLIIKCQPKIPAPLLFKQTSYERSHPNQPFYAKFLKKPKRNR